MRDLSIVFYSVGAMLLADTLGQWHGLGQFYGLEFMGGATALFFGVITHLIANLKGN